MEAKAETKTKKTAAEDDLVEIMIPPTSVKNDPGMFVSVNGKNWLLPRGQMHKVPKAVAYEIKRSWEAERKLSGVKQELSRQSE